MLHKPYKDKVEEIDELYRNVIQNAKQDSSYLERYIQQMEEFALSHQDKELLLEADLLRAFAYWSIHGPEQPESVQELVKVAQRGQREQVAHIEERAAQVIAHHHWITKNYEKSFEWLLRSAKILEGMDPKSFPDMAAHLNFIGQCYFHFKDYTTALIYYQKSSTLEKTSFNADAVLGAQNTLGLCYQNLNDFKLAESYFLMVIHDSSIYQKPAWKGIASGNLGYNFYLQKKYSEALPLFEKDIQNAIALRDLGLAAGSVIPLADIYLKEKNLDAAKQKIEEARIYIKQSGEYDRLRKLYPVMSKWYAARQLADSSAIYLDSTIIAMNAYSEKYNAIKLLKANQTVEARDRQLEVERLNTESHRKLSQRNYIIFFIAVLLLGGAFSYWFRVKYLLKERELKELRIEKAESDLMQAKNKLKHLKEKVQNEQEIIENLQKELVNHSNQKLISKLKSKIIITDDDWNKYQRIFEEAYPRYLSSLKTSYVNLTQSELRCLCLEKLELSNKEMGLLLGISSNSVMVTKHRIRKKLGLKNRHELQGLVKKIS